MVETSYTEQQEERKLPITMDTKRLKSRRTTRETMLHPPLLNEEDQKLHNGNNANLKVTDNGDPTVSTNTRGGLLNPSLKKDRKYSKNKLVTSGLETSPSRKEVITIGSFCNNLNALKLSSNDANNIDNVQQKRPIKLAPLELPQQVKEAQMKKITAMANSVYVNERKPLQRNINIPYPSSTISAPLRKLSIGENKLPKLAEEVISNKDDTSVKESSSGTHLLPRNLRLGGSSLSMMKADSRRVNDSLPKSISSQSNEGQNMFLQGPFRSTRCPNTNQGSTQVITINGPTRNYIEIRSIGKSGY